VAGVEGDTTSGAGTLRSSIAMRLQTKAEDMRNGIILRPILPATVESVDQDALGGDFERFAC
jgi:hypothetical protein